jgi:hypothetical protein
MQAGLRRCLVWSVLLVVSITASMHGQTPGPHYFLDARQPPGAIGAQQAWRTGPAVAPYFQPVRIVVPESALVSVAENGQFGAPHRGAVTVGLLVGQVYRIKVSNIPVYEDHEVFPSIEVISRLFPPPGKQWEYPVPVVLPQEDLVLALEGRLVTRVVYLEDPQRAAPVPQTRDDQPYYEAKASENILETADRLGRPMVIVRLGSRVPNWDTDNGQFLFYTPPVQWPQEAPGTRDARNAPQENPWGQNPPMHTSRWQEALEPGFSGRDIPRIPLLSPKVTTPTVLPVNR